MLSSVIQFSLKNKFIVLLFTFFLIAFGIFSLSRISIGAVPDVTNNQVQIITTSRNLSTQDMEQFITYPVELEMANLPGVREIRSISKFGLSVVTIVFDENLGTYLPRQLIAEKIESAREMIPEGFGSPTMGPITTGLGEIYQYILDVKPEYKDRYSITDLRTIQDWVVKRQLSGIPGIVEVNTWGGYLKQYEVAIDTEKLNAMNITATQVFSALENNNSVAGGGYIEKVNQAYFIRGDGLVGSFDDIRNIVVINKNGVPIYIKDVAEVGVGSAMRFGAITGNGEGEKVLGQVMMLKDENTKQVIDAVKDRVESISKSLPEGVYINAFLDRSELIEKTTHTVIENLLLGCLIVILVVVLLLGNLRSGLVVASVIPLSLLFALSMMYLFGVDANLMSLGAIDFGIIIDGAVIIVEFIAYQITLKANAFKGLDTSKTKALTDEITNIGASKMMNSAIFGQLIILIVFIPVLTLSGVEGKMFRPMALTFSFALIGAMIMCFTYVPVMASKFLKPSDPNKPTLTQRLLRKINAIYAPSIDWALRKKRFVLGMAIMLLAGSAYIFTTIGGEFIPTLDEGDFVIQPVLKTGTSLSNTIEITTEIERILLDKFPEVKQVVTRIGAAEVPTDPMSMEESDVIIILNPKNEWTSANSKDELAEKFKEALSIIPGMEVEFTQPIEMRFNELITGVRADIAIKIFGDDLSLLSRKAMEIKSKIEHIDGASDVTVEKVVGLPQMRVKFDRSQIARYGLNIKDLNDMIAMGFAGRTVGSVFEGEKRFDMVVRLKESKRQDLSDLKSLYVDLPTGGKIPLDELASITYQRGAAKISRDDTRRRIVVGVNVRNRDLQSVVEDIQLAVDREIRLPPGYNISYGGQFENLQNAKSRLKIAVPIALLLIFLMLYFAFKSARDALLIFSAIPLAAVGGVLLLWIRGMPFSISAGVGFIALFGIAVLNGIVLIEHFKELKLQGIKDMFEIIKKGTKDRLRAVLLTASAAALGFLPMAVSTHAGAEVQRPLATVVIGGLVSATLLTLIVLPVLYAYVSGNKRSGNRPKAGNKVKLLTVVILFFGLALTEAQEQKNISQLYDLALQNNSELKANLLSLEKSEALIGTAFTMEKTQLFYSYDENNLAVNNRPIDVFGIQQKFSFPTVYFASNKREKLKYQQEKLRYAISERALKKSLALAYYSYQYSRSREDIYRHLDSLYNSFDHAANRRYELGATTYLETLTARAKRQQIHLEYKESSKAVRNALITIKALVQHQDSIAIVHEPYGKMECDRIDIKGLNEYLFFQNKIALSKAERKLETHKLFPDLNLEYFEGTNSGLNSNLKGYQFGLSIPLLFNGQSARIKSLKLAEEQAGNQARDMEIKLISQHDKLQAELEQLQAELKFFEVEGRTLSEEIFKTANRSFSNGEIDFYQYIISLENAYEIDLTYLEKLHRYNQTVIAINYLTF